MRPAGSISGHEQEAEESFSTHSQQEAAKSRRKHPVHFTEWEREDQLLAFFAWLPKDLHDAPGIDWSTLPPGVMGYCVHTIGNSPDAAHLAVAAISAFGAMNASTLLALLGNLNILLRTIREVCQLKQLSELRSEQVWQDFLVKTERISTRREKVQAYASVTMKHFPAYLQRLHPSDRSRMQTYAFPPLPYDFLHRHFPYQRILAAQQAKRKAHSDIVTPLYPVLRQLIRFRKQLAERVLLAIREARRKVEMGEASLPLAFAHTDIIPEVNRDARTIAEVQIGGREVTMKFVLWDKRTWVRDHHDRFSGEVINDAKAGRETYCPEQNIFFVQYDAPVDTLLWFGDLIENRILQQFQSESQGETEAYRARRQFARKLGFTNGCYCSSAGLLNSSEKWLAENARPGDLFLEFESLYRGVLFGAALAMISLSNGSRVSELLQVSWNKERRVTRTETVRLLGEDGQPRVEADGKPALKQVKIHLQHLLPKGAKTEEERQLFPLSKECMRLLGEIKQLLEETHGRIPTIWPSRSSSKYEHLKPEQYLFQWAATPDGKHGIFGIADVQILLRFILHGLDLYTAQGEPIRVSAHLLRHLMATHARQYRHVPPEAIAHFFLHHRVKELDYHASRAAEISHYYFQMTEEQRFTLIRADLDEQEEMDRALLQAMPVARDLEQMNEDLRMVYQLWHALHPTALGNCGCPGLCPRGNDRALCLGCSYLVTDPEKMGAALAWRTSYAQQAALFEAQGNDIDARQARIKVQQLDDVIAVMRLQLQAEADGSYIPLHKILPSPYRHKDEYGEKES